MNDDQDHPPGHLTIFLGAAPGVGKTYAMLRAAKSAQRGGKNVMAAVVETHRRRGTEKLLKYFPTIPKKNIIHQDKAFAELDTEAILKVRPDLALIDELAHTNVPGSRHNKRYLDVLEVLKAGIDVYTTLNVQHLESLKDTVKQITGIEVRATVPDDVLLNADEIMLIDLPPQTLLQRLREGKVYLGDMKQNAIEHYFTEQNLMALRELALKSASRNVNQQISDIKKLYRIKQPWGVSEVVLVCIAPEEERGDFLIRQARQCADTLNAKLLAVYVERPTEQLSPLTRARLQQHLAYAEKLGADTLTLVGLNRAKTIVKLTQEENVTHIFLSKRRTSWYEKIFGSTLHDIIRHTKGIHLHLVTDDRKITSHHKKEKFFSKATSSTVRRLLCILLLITGIGGIALGLPYYFQNTSVALLLLWVIMGAAYFWGVGFSLFAAIVSFIYFDFFHLIPLYSLAIYGPHRILTFIVFITTALVISQLTGYLKNIYKKADLKQARTSLLYRFTKLITDSDKLMDMLQKALFLMDKTFQLPMMLWLIEDDHLVLRMTSRPGLSPDPKLTAAVKWCWQNQQTCGTHTDTLSEIGWHILLLQSAHANVGVLVVATDQQKTFFQLEQQHLFHSLTNQLSTGICKMQLESMREKANILSETDKLQQALLHSVSHDLRTPLASIMRSLTSLLNTENKFSATRQQELLTSALEDSERLNRYITNLFTLTKLEAGKLPLDCTWCDLRTLIQHALDTLQQPLSHYHCACHLSDSLPLVWVDATMTEQVMINLLDNAMKYSPVGSTIHLSATVQQETVVFTITDEGCGLEPTQFQHIFDPFYRTSTDPEASGSGIGLAICKGILAAEAASIVAWSAGINRGSVFTIHFSKTQPHEKTQPL